VPLAVSAGREGQWAELRVADNGPGIAPEHLLRIFERFYRVDEVRSRSQGGAGLGLSISQWIAQALAGEITVDSQPGLGTTFTVQLPIAHNLKPS
jgi:two-component system, OmpR family, sensor kinase